MATVASTAYVDNSIANLSTSLNQRFASNADLTNYAKSLSVLSNTVSDFLTFRAGVSTTAPGSLALRDAQSQLWANTFRGNLEPGANNTNLLIGTQNPTRVDIGTALTTQRINIGTGLNSSAPTTITIGSVFDSVVIPGTLQSTSSTSVPTMPALLQLNPSGSVNSAGNCGIEVLEANNPVAMFQVATTRDGWVLKAPTTQNITFTGNPSTPYTISQGSHDPLSIASSATGLSLSSQVLNLSLANSSSAGAMGSDMYALLSGSTDAPTPSAIAKRNANGQISAALIGNVTGNVSGTASGFTGTLSGQVTGTQTNTVLAPGVVSDSNVATLAGIQDSKLGTIQTAGKVANSATSATSANTPNTIVARDVNGSINVGNITTGSASTANMNILSGSVNTTSLIGIGRTASEAQVGVSCANNDILNSAIAGDLSIRTLSASNKVLLGSASNPNVSIASDYVRVLGGTVLSTAIAKTTSCISDSQAFNTHYLTSSSPTAGSELGLKLLYSAVPGSGVTSGSCIVFVITFENLGTTPMNATMDIVMAGANVYSYRRVMLLLNTSFSNNYVDITRVASSQNGVTADPQVSVRSSGANLTVTCSLNFNQSTAGSVNNISGEVTFPYMPGVTRYTVTRCGGIEPFST